MSLSACAGTPWGSQVEQALQTDPQLQDQPLFGRQATALPTTIPRYPNATQQPIPPDIETTLNEPIGQLTYWITPDSPEQVQQFYQAALQADGWTLLESLDPNGEEPEADTTTSPAGNRADQPEAGNQTRSNQTNESDASGPSNPSSQQFVAQRDQLRVRVMLLPNDSRQSGTAFTIEFDQGADQAIVNPNPSESSTPDPETTATPSGDRPSSAPSSSKSQNFTDIDQAPEELQGCIQDLAALGFLSTQSSGPINSQTAESQSNASLFKPNQAITRREYARWLFAANNAIYTHQPEQRIRPGVTSAQPAFQDVPSRDPDFSAIQGLAEAGLIPSPLSGSPTTVTFRPDAPLTREELILWKVPLDTRQALPTASVEAVQQTWAFQDAAKIDPKALRAVLADYQNGEFSNIRRAFGYTTLFQPDKPVTRAEASAVLCRFGNQSEGISAEEAKDFQARQSEER